MEEKEETLRQKLRYDMRLRVSRTDHAFGPGVAELMEHVEATGSLLKGCKCMQMAYSKGWKILKRAEEDLGIPLVQGNRGGSNGGQTVLTPEGKEFLKRYRKFEQEKNNIFYGDTLTKRVLSCIFINGKSVILARE